jgi:hypothetical protein
VLTSVRGKVTTSEATSTVASSTIVASAAPQDRSAASTFELDRLARTRWWCFEAWTAIE